MGKNQSKGKNFYRSKNKKESSNDFRLLLKNRFSEIADGKLTIDKSNFFRFTEATISPQLQLFIYDSLSKSENAITEERFIQFAEMMVGDFMQQSEALLLLDQPMKEILEALISSFFKCEDLGQESITILVDYLMENMPLQLDPYGLSNFIQHKMILLIIIKHISRLLLLEPKDNNKLLPTASKSSLLTPAALCLLYANLPEDLRAYWKLIFSSEKDGESFTKLLKSVDGAGPCLIIIETTSGHVFGAFASRGFTCGPSHTGDNRCFLFEDRLKLRIYNATGYNSNFGYLNSHQFSLPNGIGMGGNGMNWSFFLHEDFGSGTSTAGISTFEKCWLAGEETFKPKNVEIWQIGEKRKERMEGANVQDEFVQQRLLMNERETRLVLKLSGKEFRGDAFRKRRNS